jgi:tRNA (guanine-N7-)-methyltransferase
MDPAQRDDPVADAHSRARAHPGDGPVADAALAHRHIRSFAMRRGHLSDGQRRAYDDLLPTFGIAFQAQPIDFRETFGRQAPVVLEIGFGMGGSTAEIAAAHPATDFLCVEVYTPGVGSLLRQVAERGLRNIRVVQHDAVEVLRDMVPPDSLAGVHVFFPDPWPKKRHHKRRLIQPPSVAALATRIAPGGYLHCATDWEDYAVQMLEVLSAEPLLENTAAGYAPRPDHRPPTKFERRGLRLGHGVWDLIFRRRMADAPGPP